MALLKVTKQSGFTLIELISVILILSVLTAGVASQFSNPSSFQAMTTRDDIVAGLFYAQQIAQARAATDNTIQFVSNGNSIDVREDGASVNNGIYPLALPSGFTLSSATLGYDKLGRTTATSLSLSDGSSSALIQISASGYAN